VSEGSHSSAVAATTPISLSLESSSVVEDWSDPNLIGQHCCVAYDGKAYPGVIRNIDECDVEVECMHSVGINRFFWPEKRLDVCWYPFDAILAIIPEPVKIGSRYRQVEPQVWEAVMQKLAVNNTDK